MFQETLTKKIALSTPYMNGHEIAYIQEAFDTNWIAPLGANVDGFEKEMCEYINANHAVAMSSGTSAIHMALRYVGAERDDYVFCSSLTFAATCNPIIYQNATPVFIDSEPDTWNMSPQALRHAFKTMPNPKAVIVVNLYGTAPKLDEIVSICNEYNVPLIEDAAESLGTTYKGIQTGTFGKFGILSFNGNKIITTSGGGMLLCDTKEARDKIQFWITQSRDKARHYQHTELGFNYRMSNICAGIGRGQLLDLDSRVLKKQSFYNTYKNIFSDILDIKMNPYEDCCIPNNWLSCITIDSTNKIKPIDIMTTLEKENIETRPIWKPMNLQPFYSNCKFVKHDDSILPVCDDIFNRGVCLPSDLNMTLDEQERVISIIKGLF